MWSPIGELCYKPPWWSWNRTDRHAVALRSCLHKVEVLLATCAAAHNSWWRHTQRPTRQLSQCVLARKAGLSMHLVELQPGLWTMASQKLPPARFVHQQHNPNMELARCTEEPTGITVNQRDATSWFMKLLATSPDHPDKLVCWQQWVCMPGHTACYGQSRLDTKHREWLYQDLRKFCDAPVLEVTTTFGINLELNTWHGMPG